WNLALRILGAIKTVAYIYLVPVITVAASVVILHEPLTPVIVIGVVLTCLGLVVSERGKTPIAKASEGKSLIESGAAK
ncbi:MAG: EamA family transporter, partial [Raoultibacter sp.]